MSAKEQTRELKFVRDVCFNSANGQDKTFEVFNLNRYKKTYDLYKEKLFPNEALYVLKEEYCLKHQLNTKNCFYYSSSGDIQQDYYEGNFTCYSSGLLVKTNIDFHKPAMNSVYKNMRAEFTIDIEPHKSSFTQIEQSDIEDISYTYIPGLIIKISSNTTILLSEIKARRLFGKDIWFDYKFYCFEKNKVYERSLVNADIGKICYKSISVFPEIFQNGIIDLTKANL